MTDSLMTPILFYVKNRQGFAGLFRVLEQLERRGHKRLFLTTDDQAVRAYSQSFRENLPQRFVELDEAAKCNWAAVVSTHLPPGNVSLNGPLMLICHGTGFGIGGVYNTVLAANCDLYFGSDPEELQFFKNWLGDEFPDERFVAAGIPHTDELAQYVNRTTTNRCELKRDLGLDPNLPVILVTSHWTPNSILRTWGIGTLAALEPFANSHSIVQIAHKGIWDFPAYDTYIPGVETYKHPRVFDSAKLYQELRTYCKYRTRVHFLPDANALKCLAVADLLVGDYSSIIAEFCALDRPIVFTNRKDRFFDAINYQRYAAACGAADSLDQLAAVATAELNSPDKRSGARQDLANAFIWNLGNAAATVADEILKRI